MNAVVLLDSSAWIELFCMGPAEKKCRSYFEQASEVIVPTIVQYEVYRKIRLVTSEDRALSCVSLLNQQIVSPLTTEVALLAADLSVEYELGMADSLILAHCRMARAELVTLDNDFARFPEARVVRR